MRLVERVVGRHTGDRPGERACVAARHHRQPGSEVLVQLHGAPAAVLVRAGQGQQADTVAGQDRRELGVVDRAEQPDVRWNRRGTACRQRAGDGERHGSLPLCQRSQRRPAEAPVERSRVDDAGALRSIGVAGEMREVDAVLDHDRGREGVEVQAPEHLVRRGGDAVDGPDQTPLHRGGVSGVGVGGPVDRGAADAADRGVRHQRLVHEGEAGSVEALLAQDAAQVAGGVEAGGQHGRRHDVPDSEPVDADATGGRPPASLVPRRVAQPVQEREGTRHVQNLVAGERELAGQVVAAHLEHARLMGVADEEHLTGHRSDPLTASASRPSSPATRPATWFQS
jgi:hypothetical protein